mmetsp:Transcript_17898/g.54783  ORF Transcript_17898/g.54783 Transcript_17898/m.54783 type:complete len:306 (+) Transcript_17898:1823-2740(+)
MRSMVPAARSCSACAVALLLLSVATSITSARSRGALRNSRRASCRRSPRPTSTVGAADCLAVASTPFLLARRSTPPSSTPAGTAVTASSTDAAEIGISSAASAPSPPLPPPAEGSGAVRNVITSCACLSAPQASACPGAPLSNAITSASVNPTPSNAPRLPAYCLLVRSSGQLLRSAATSPPPPRPASHPARFASPSSASRLAESSRQRAAPTAAASPASSWSSAPASRSAPRSTLIAIFSSGGPASPAAVAVDAAAASTAASIAASIAASFATGHSPSASSLDARTQVNPGVTPASPRKPAPCR